MTVSIAEIVGNVSIGCAAAASFLKSVEWLLTAKQKSWLAAKSILLWNWIDDWRARSLVLELTTGRAQVIVAALSIIAAEFVIFSIVIGPSTDNEWPLIMSCLLSSLSVLWISLRYLMPFIGRLTSPLGTSPFIYFGSFGLFAAGGSKLALLFLRAVYMTENGWESVVINMIVLFVTMNILGLSVLILAIGLLLAIGWALVLTLQVTLTILEFPLRRIAETPGGPVVGFSIVLGSVGGIFKMIS